MWHNTTHHIHHTMSSSHEHPAPRITVATTPRLPSSGHKMGCHVEPGKGITLPMTRIEPPQQAPEACGLFAIYVSGHCVLPKGHRPAADHRSQYGEAFTRGLTKDEGGHE